MGDFGDRSAAELSGALVLILLPPFLGMFYSVRVLSSRRTWTRKTIGVVAPPLALVLLLVFMALVERALGDVPILRLGSLPAVLLTLFSIGVVMTTIALLPAHLARALRTRLRRDP